MSAHVLVWAADFGAARPAAPVRCYDDELLPPTDLVYTTDEAIKRYRKPVVDKPKPKPEPEAAPVELMTCTVCGRETRNARPLCSWAACMEQRRKRPPFDRTKHRCGHPRVGQRCQHADCLAGHRERNRLRMAAVVSAKSRDADGQRCTHCDRRARPEGTCSFAECIAKRKAERVAADSELCSMCMKRRRTGDVICGSRACRARLERFERKRASE